MSFVGNPKMLKEVNSSSVERCLFARGPLSKPELAKLTNLSLPTVSKIVDDLEEKSLVCPVGFTASGAGRKAVLYQINQNSGCVIVLYYSWGKYLCRLADVVGNTLHEVSSGLDSRTAEAAIDSTFSAIDSMLTHTPSELKAIGVGIPGAVMPDGKLFAIPKIPAWEGFDLGDALSKRYGVAISVENDVKLAAFGCFRTFLKEEFDNIVYIYAGNGMGSGIIINKKLYHGSNNFSGELGFLASLDGELPGFDYTLEGGYLEKKLNTLIKQVGGRFSAYENEKLINYFTEIAADYIAVINPAAIVFGGEVFDDDMIDEIRIRVVNYAPSCSIPHILYDDSGSRGLDGLVLACIGRLTTEVQIVQNGGV